MSQAPQGPPPPSTPQQFGPPPWQQAPPGGPGLQQLPGGIPPQPGFVPPQQHWPHPGQQSPLGFPLVSPPPRGNGWWITSAVLAFVGASSAVSVFGAIAFIGGILGLFVAAEGGEEGVRQISDDFVHTTSGLFYLFLALQLVMTVVGLWGGRNCLRGKTSGALMTMLAGALGLGEVIWLGIVFDEPARMAMGILAALALIVCPAIALRFPQSRRK